jgi:hypothetical protein
MADDAGGAGGEQARLRASASSSAPREKPGETGPYSRGYCQAGVCRGFSSAIAGAREHSAITCSRPPASRVPIAVAAGGGSLKRPSTPAARPTQKRR